MKRITFFIYYLLPLVALAQTNMAHLQKKSKETFVYKINTALAEKYIKEDSINVDDYLLTEPFYVFNSDSINVDVLPKGLYILVSVKDNLVVAELQGVSDLYAYTVNNQQRLQVFVRNKKGELVTNAEGFLKGKRLKFNPSTNSFWIKKKNPDGEELKIYTPSDTTFISLMADEELDKSILQQRIHNILHSRTGRIITWLPKKFLTLFRKKYHYKSNNTGAAGTMVFNQPKYKITDTVKLKAYVFNKHWKSYKKPVKVYLSYYANGKRNEQYLTQLGPRSPGSFVFSFPLSDTLVRDVQYTVAFKTGNNKNVISGSFKIEDYLLDEVTTCNLRSSKELIYANDTLHLYASATDANGLSLLDAKAQLAITVSGIGNFFKDSLQIPDTLYVAKKKLLAEGETVYDVPTDNFPDANMQINANVTFINSNNETQEKDKKIDYRPGNKEIWAIKDNDTIRAEYRLNGKSIIAKGIVTQEGDLENSKEISYPFKTKFDPMAESYTFYAINNTKKTDSFSLEINDEYQVYLNRISTRDTLGFELINTKKIPVTYSVWDGNRLVWAGTGDSEKIRWSSAAVNRHKIYTVKWEYYYGGNEKLKQETIALLYKLLNINVQSNSSVFPGQRDTIAIEVKDYKDKPLANVNLTALSFNSQFNKDINVHEPPYLVKYHRRPFILIDKYEQDEGFILENYSLGKHQDWIKKFKLDTMPYYRALFPVKGFADLVTAIGAYVPQVSVHVVKQGIKQAIYLLYINRNLVYYNGVTDRAKDAYPVYPGLAQFGIRLYDRVITLDSIYLQPFYKHDIFIDLDHYSGNITTESVPVYFSYTERNLLENSLWNLDNKYRTNYGYVWQNNLPVHLSGSNQHIVGPFSNGDSLHFYAPSDFDIHFTFEAGYQYDLTPKIYRLEKKPIFRKEIAKIYLPKINDPAWILGDTIELIPEITYPAKPLKINLVTSSYFEWFAKQHGTGKIKFTVAKDTMPLYTILYSLNEHKVKVIFDGDRHLIDNIDPGDYSILVVSKNNKTAQTQVLHIEANKTLCIHTEKIHFLLNNKVLADLINPQPDTIENILKEIDGTVLNNESQNFYDYGKSSVSGKVIDKKGGNGIPFAAITIKGTRTATTTAADGSFTMKNIQSGKCVLIVSSIGYNSKQIEVVAGEGFNAVNIIELQPSSQALSDVVVVGYGTTIRRNLAGSISYFREQNLTNTLSGKVAGLLITGEPGLSNRINIRGLRSGSSNNPIYIIDGILYDQMPANISQDMIGEVMVLKSAEAIAIYGDRASEGAIVITTKFKANRNQFRDYAFWQPELFTDKNGKASFAVTYPDNVTGWRIFVLGMDKKRHMGKTETFVKAYKPILAQLSEPQFLIEGDSVSVVGKALNYSNDNYQVNTIFTANYKTIENGILLNSKASEIRQFPVIANAEDSLKAGFALQTTTGFKDAEERAMPVFKRGTEESNGAFYILNSDTTINFRSERAGSVQVYVENNTLELLLSEIDYLKKYPYYCMEQTASKLKGLLMEKKIKENLGQSFNDQKMVDFLLRKIQQSQLFDGGWGWWPNSKADIYISNYVISALLPLRSNVLIETFIRNGLLFLQNNLPVLNKEQLLLTLATMANANHAIDYSPWIEKIHFDSLSIYQQWLFVKLKQQLRLDHDKELEQVMKRSIPGMLGSLHWGEQTFRWYNTATIATTAAFDVLLHEKEYQKQLPGIIQYFLEERHSGHWTNTVESAGIVASILPYVLSLNNKFIQPTTISISGDTSLILSQFPYKKTFANNTVHNLTVTKQGGGINYLTLYQQSFNNNPKPVDNNFKIKSFFEENQQQIANLKAGEKCMLKIDVNALKEAEYVMIEIPIPAGCTYSTKNQDEINMHKEFLKNKVVIFTEHLDKGDHQFTIELEPRYGGIFSLNPVKVSLMYFPIFYGRNEMKKVLIK